MFKTMKKIIQAFIIRTVAEDISSYGQIAREIKTHTPEQPSSFQPLEEERMDTSKVQIVPIIFAP